MFTVVNDKLFSMSDDRFFSSLFFAGQYRMILSKNTASPSRTMHINEIPNHIKAYGSTEFNQYTQRAQLIQVSK